MANRLHGVFFVETHFKPSIGFFILVSRDGFTWKSCHRERPQGAPESPGLSLYGETTENRRSALHARRVIMFL